MNDTSGPLYAQPLMRYDQDTQSWRTSLDTSLWDLPMSSVTLPASGLMRSGVLFERPMLARPTSATGSSSLPTPLASMGNLQRDDFTPNLRTVIEGNPTLPTPRAQNGEERNMNIWERPADQPQNLENALANLPTPKAGDGERGRDLPRLRPDVSSRELATTVGFLATLPTPHAGLGERGRDGVILNPKGQQDLQHTLAHLMPTPTVMDMGNNKTPEEWTAWKDEQRAKHNNGNGHGESLTQAAIAWGKYEPAIRRWENLTREVPEPTVPHKDKRRLNPAFVEWMMGLPEGHVTGHGLSAAKELKMLGNGVVPQQARSAITQLMERITQ